MKLECHACQARYTLADDKIRGKIVKIRCRKCRTIVVVDGAVPAVEVSSPREMGARGEESVLFTLSALQEARATVASTAPVLPADDSGLIDLRMLSSANGSASKRGGSSDPVAHLGLGVFAAQMPAPEPRPGERTSRRFRLVIAGVGSLGLALALLSPAIPARRGPGPGPASPPSLAAMPQPEVAAPQRIGMPEMPRPEEVPKPHEAPLRQARVFSAPIASSSAFDAPAASRTLGSVDLTPCALPGVPIVGHARVTLEPSGAVSGAVVDTPELAGTKAAICIAAAYRRMRVSTFSGSALTVGKRFSVPAIESPSSRAEIPSN